MSEYSDKLKDPRWQKKRLSVFNERGFVCQACRSEKKQLHIHHKRYPDSGDPWDCENSDLLCLCEDCHFERHYVEKKIFSLVSGLSQFWLYRLLGYLEALTKSKIDIDNADIHRAAREWGRKDKTDFPVGIDGLGITKKGKIAV